MRKKISEIFDMIFSIPKTVFINFRCFPLNTAIKFPVFINRKVQLKKIGGKGSIVLDEVKTGIVQIGFCGSFGLGGKGYWECLGTIYFMGNAKIGRGSQIIVHKNAKIIFGKNFSGNANCIYNAAKQISFGDDCMVGWNSTIIDADGHKIISPSGKVSGSGTISIGNHVWICCDVKILKNTKILDCSVCATNSLISKQFHDSHLLIGGNNHVIKQNINWER